ncbi:hypothetical protein AALA56_04335 [Streptococcus hyointestinalis]|uniref:hypothetical protein n=1 Tax=Streptococcus hyointestinalis TaxID=1337 RepID=UPI003514462D
MKYTKIILIVISLIWTSIHIYSAITSPNVVNFTSFLGIIPIIAGLYSEIDWIYINWNKLRAYLFLKTVSFAPKSYKYIDDSIEFSDLESLVRSSLDTNDYMVEEAYVKRTEEDLYMRISKDGLKSDLTLNFHKKADGWLLIFKIDYQLAYRDVNKFWKSFISIRNELFSQFAKMPNSKERYDVTIQTTKEKNYNPFYRLTVKHIGKSEIKSFNLKFTDNKLTVTTNMNKIHGTSSNYQDIEKLIKEYIPLSRT